MCRKKNRDMASTMVIRQPTTRESWRTCSLRVHSDRASMTQTKNPSLTRSDRPKRWKAIWVVDVCFSFQKC